MNIAIVGSGISGLTAGYLLSRKNNITVFDFHVGHNIPEAKGGTLSLENLRPICSRCNHSMGCQYTITEWTRLHHNIRQPCCCFF